MVEVELPNAQAAMSAYYVPPARRSATSHASTRCATATATRGIHSAASTRPAARRALPRGAPPHHAGQLPSVGQGVRHLLHPPSRCARSSRRTTRGLRARWIASSRRVAAHGVQVRRSERPHRHVSVGHVHHLHQYRRQRRHEPAVQPPRRSPVGVQLISPQFTTRTCCAWGAGNGVYLAPPPAFAPWPRTPKDRWRTSPTPDATPRDLPGLLTEEGTRPTSSAAQRGV